MRQTIQVQLPLLLLLVGILAIASLYHYLLKHEIESQKTEVSRSLNAAGTRLAGMTDYLLQQKADDALHMEVSLLGQFPDLMLAVVVDEQNHILHASQPAWHHRTLSESPLAVASPLIERARETMSGHSAEFDEGRLMIGVYAFQMPIKQDDLSSQGTGMVVMGIDQTHSILAVREEVRRIATVAGSVLVLFTFLLWYALHRMLTRPVQALVHTTRAFAAGNYNSSANIALKNEMGELSTALDTLAVTAIEREQILERNLRLAKIVENSVNEIYVLDADSFQVIDANHAARENLAYSKEEILRLYPWDFALGMNREDVTRMTSQLLDGTIDVASFETVHKRKDGSTYPVATRLQSLANLTPPVFSAIVQDITELQIKQTELNLRDRAIAEVDVGVLITDARQDDNPIVYANAAIEEMTGYLAEELIGHNPRLLQGDDHDQVELKNIKDALNAELPIQVLLRNYRKDGTQFMDELTISPVRDSNDVVTHHIGIQRDVTQRLATDARLLQAQKIDAIGQLSGGIAHDFNNLLNVIIGNLEFLKMDLTDPALRDYADEADSAAQMGARLTKRLLAFARKGTLEPTVVNINDQLLAAMELLQSTIGETITLSSNLSQDLWTTRADPSEVENMVVNLAINARDAMPKGGQIHIETSNVTLDKDTSLDIGDAAPGDYVKMTVSDNGSGMSSEVVDRIFEPFYTTKSEGKGTGLGLSSIYGFTQQSGGHITVESTIGEGTTFTVFLPRCVESKDSISDTAVQSIATQTEKARILVVEDNELVCKLTVRRLQSLGFEILTANDGPSALSVLESETNIALVFSDVVMDGGMSGYDVAQWVQNNIPDCQILLTSGYTDQLADDSDIDVISINLLHKPHTIQELQQAITHALINTTD